MHLLTKYPAWCTLYGVMEDVTEAIQALKRQQAKHGWPDWRLADEIGISRSDWSKIKNGSRPFGLKARVGSANRFPRLKGIFLPRDYTTRGTPLGKEGNE